MFHYDRGLMLTRARLAIDVCRRQPRGFISHAHCDHMARHEYALCTPETAALYHFRCGKRPTLEMPYGETLDWGDMRLTTYPAGHCLGSAMLLADDGDSRLLYTGDFKLSESATARRAELPRADILVMETTFGNPAYRSTPRARAIEQLLDLVHKTLLAGEVPVIQAYSLGKSQEVTRILSDAGFPVLQHQKVYEISCVYEACGMSLGKYSLYPGRPLPGHVIVTPPQHCHEIANSSRQRIRTFAVTGWAMGGSPFRLRVDHAIPLSDHADYHELIEAIDRVEPREIYCTHGPAAFVGHLRSRGYNAYSLDGSFQVETPRQLALF